MLPVPDGQPSSLAPSWVNELTTDPVYAPRVVSKLEVHVLKVATPVDGAVHTNHTDWIGDDKAVFAGSPGSPVACRLLPGTVPLAPKIGRASANGLSSMSTGSTEPGVSLSPI